MLGDTVPSTTTTNGHDHQRKPDATGGSGNNDVEDGLAAQATAAAEAEIQRQHSLQEETMPVEMGGAGGQDYFIPHQPPVLARIAVIVSWAVLGACLRIVLDGAIPVNNADYLASNFLGTLVLGFIDVLKGAPNSPMPVLTHLGIAVGLCGSWTTFSSWQVDVTKSTLGLLSQSALQQQHSVSFQIYSFFANELIGVAVPVCGFYVGKHIATEIVRSHWWMMQGSKRRGDVHTETTIWYVVMACVMTAVVLGAGLRQDFTSFSLVLAPFGALTRYGLSHYLNTPVPRTFFIGTLVSNIVGTCILAIMTVLQLSDIGLDLLTCAWLNAIGLGYSGSLSTVSTFIKELVGGALINTHSSYLYGFVSVISTQGISLIILGSVLGANRAIGVGSCTIVPGNVTVGA